MTASNYPLHTYIIETLLVKYQLFNP